MFETCKYSQVHKVQFLRSGESDPEEASMFVICFKICTKVHSHNYRFRDHFPCYVIVVSRGGSRNFRKGGL